MTRRSSMTSSPEVAAVLDGPRADSDRVGVPAGAADVPQPPALEAMWRLCRLGLTHEPRLMVIAFVLAMLAAVPDALFALWLKLLSNGATAGNHTEIYV